MGNDGICLYGVKKIAMDDMNARSPGTFTKEDHLRNTCTIEGLENTAACQRLRSSQEPIRATHIADQAP